jgi:carbon storage regulator
MLILSRKEGESLVIGDNIRIFIMPNPNQNSRQVRIGIDAPRDIKVLRSELEKRDG